jgi:uncharacterized protein YbjT (DUF2867 family)
MNIVLGATGTIGRGVVQSLRAAGHPVRAVVRNAATAKGSLPDSVDFAAADLTEPSSLAGVFAGGDALFLLVPVAPNQSDLELDALRVARSAGVRRVVKLSAIGADPLARGYFSRSHGVVEAALRGSGLGWTIVRGAFFYSNLLFAADTIKRHSQYVGHWADHPAAWVDPADLAAVCARCLTDPGLAGETLTATGPAALTNAQLCEVLSRALGRPIRYIDQSPAEYEKTLVAHGGPEWYARAEVALGDVVRSGVAREVTHVVERLTGRPPRSMSDYVSANQGAFAPERT